MGQSFGLPRRMILWNIVLPGAGRRFYRACATRRRSRSSCWSPRRWSPPTAGWDRSSSPRATCATIDQLLAGLLVLLVLGTAIGFLMSMLERWLLALALIPHAL